jgi:hypothetical protein
MGIAPVPPELPNNPSRWECARDCWLARQLLGEAALADEVQTFEHIGAMVSLDTAIRAQRVPDCEGPAVRRSWLGRANIWCPAVRSAIVRPV